MSGAVVSDLPLAVVKLAFEVLDDVAVLPLVRDAKLRVRDMLGRVHAQRLRQLVLPVLTRDLGGRSAGRPRAQAHIHAMQFGCVLRAGASNGAQKQCCLHRHDAVDGIEATLKVDGRQIPAVWSVSRSFEFRGR